MSRNNETSGVELVVVGVFAFCLAVVAWLMKTFDVEWQTALETAPGLIVWLLVVGAGIFFGIKMETGLVRWGAPLAIALLIPVFKPILKEAAGVREMGGLVFDDMVSWYGTGWGMSLMFSVFLSSDTVCFIGGTEETLIIGKQFCSIYQR